MKKIRFSFVAVIIFLLAFSGCGTPAPILSPTPSLTATVLPPTFNSPLPAVTLSADTASVKTTLELQRNGKTYEILVGYVGYNAGNSATPIPNLINAQGGDSVSLKWSSDIDKDGEIEYIVSSLNCAGANCLEAEAPYVYETIQVYKYDLAGDKYLIADKFQAKLPAVKTYMDVDHDGNPELITSNYGFCYLCTAYRVQFSPITILQFEQGKFRDITEKFPDLIEKDSVKLLEEAKTNTYEGSVPLASYFYDMYRLGKAIEAREVVLQICEKTVKPNEGVPGVFSCNKYLESIEIEIKRYESKP